MVEPRSIELHINGETHVVSPHTGHTLLHVLRSTLSLTGTKRGCNQGVCGTCTVLRNGVPARACLTLARECDEEEITTIEGVAPDGKLSAVQEAFVKVAAPQCGFCIPGMVLVATALLRDKPRPDQGEIREALSGNLCRCTGYVKIAEAIELVAEHAV